MAGRKRESRFETKTLSRTDLERRMVLSSQSILGRRKGADVQMDHLFKLQWSQTA